MKHRVLVIVLSSLLIFFSACSKKKAKPEGTGDSSDLPACLDINIDELKPVDTIRFSSLFESFQIIPLETNERCLIGSVSHILVEHDTIYIQDNYQAEAIFIFDLNGNFIRRIGRNGKGPGEYIRPDEISINFESSDIYILDRRQQKIIVYNTSGKFSREISLDGDYNIHQFEFYDGRFYIDQIVFPDQPNPNLLLELDQSGNILTQRFNAEVYNKGCTQPMNIARFTLIRTNYDLKFISTFLDTVFSISEGNVHPFISVTSENGLTRADMDELNGLQLNDLGQYLFGRCKKFMGLFSYLESSELIYLQFRNNQTTYSAFIDPLSKEVNYTSELKDEITYLKQFKSFNNASEDNFVVCLWGPRLTQSGIIENLKNRKINLSEEDQAKLDNYSLEDNPLVIIYKCRSQINI